MVHKFTRTLCKTGDNQLLIEQKVTAALQQIQQKTNQDPGRLFQAAIEMLSPSLECGSYKRGAKIVRVPLPVVEYRGHSYAFRWLKKTLAKKKRPPQPLEDRLANEILLVLEGKSQLLQRKADMHREALNNRTQAHLRWEVGYK